MRLPWSTRRIDELDEREYWQQAALGQIVQAILEDEDDGTTPLPRPQSPITIPDADAVSSRLDR